MKFTPKSIGILSAAGGPVSSISIFEKIIEKCQKKYNCIRSHEYPPIHLTCYPYSELMLPKEGNEFIAISEIKSVINHMKFIGMQIVLIPCFTLSSYLKDKVYYGIHVIDIGSVLQEYINKNKIENPMIICSEKARISGCFENLFTCRFPSKEMQQKINLLIEKGLQMNKVDLQPIMDEYKNETVVCASQILNSQKEKYCEGLLDTNDLIIDIATQLSFS